MSDGLLIAVFGFLGTAIGVIVGVWRERRRSKEKYEERIALAQERAALAQEREAQAKRTDTQDLIDQLQEQLKAQGDDIREARKDIAGLQAQVRVMQTREIAWISHTAHQAQIIASVPLEVPPLPPELTRPLGQYYNERPHLAPVPEAGASGSRSPDD